MQYLICALVFVLSAGVFADYPTMESFDELPPGVNPPTCYIGSQSYPVGTNVRLVLKEPTSQGYTRIEWQCQSAIQRSRTHKRILVLNVNWLPTRYLK